MKQVMYNAYIDKAYFPKKLWTNRFDSVFMAWKVKAPVNSRTEVANKIWEQNKDNLLPLMLPHIKHVSINVSGGSGVKSLSSTEESSRLIPIRVM
jgi:hypothetical protein